MLLAARTQRILHACRFFQKEIQLAFMMRLSKHLHQLYCSNRSYYAASVLGGACSTNAHTCL